MKHLEFNFGEDSEYHAIIRDLIGQRAALLAACKNALKCLAVQGHRYLQEFPSSTELEIKAAIALCEPKPEQG